MTRIIERTVMFADLRGSTALYESLGNADATSVVTQSVALAGRVVAACGGTVVKTLGDGLMAMFGDSASAVKAADEMHDALERIGNQTGAAMISGLASRSSGNRALMAMKLQVAMACGEVVEMAGDFFGDSVNVAARLLAHAGDNETLATSVVVEGLNAIERARFRSLDRMQLRGRAEPVHVYLLEMHRAGEVATTTYGDLHPTPPEPEGIQLTWLDLNKIYAAQSLPVVLGRSPEATYCIDDSRVSRSHARIDWHGGTFQLTDLSYNGTFVRFAGDSGVVSLRRGTCTLHGSGVLGLGSSPQDISAPCVRFEVLRFPETQPQAYHDFGAS